MAQVLHGLLYLHDQGVIHRDIKGANILTTKDGMVKLADFGVATKATGLHESSVVGSPYWMAPEVIELSGATTASDIWSLGCTVIELLEGKPPYHKLQPMPALFRIVNDDHPPLPEGASPVRPSLRSPETPSPRAHAKHDLGRTGLPDAMLPEGPQSSGLGQETAKTPMDRQRPKIGLGRAHEPAQVRRSRQERAAVESRPEITRCELAAKAVGTAHGQPDPGTA